ncbi:MAG: hypothetical protein OXD30_09900 [Bryobacterales bacterium]|nr:hypothetical protein [Bryobacterales bacterium]
MPDALSEAYAAQYPGLAAERSLSEHWEVVQEAGTDSASGFISGLKGKLAEFKAAETLEQSGFTDVSIAASPVQPGWDISAVNQAGETVLFQVKTGSDTYVPSVMADMQNEAGVDFMVGAELHAAISETSPDLANRLTEIGSDFELVEGIEDGLATLSESQGMDIPDSLGEALPAVGSLVAAITLIRGAINTERKFREVDRTSKNKLHVVQALSLMCRFGITAVCAQVGGAFGAAAGTVLPGAGNLAGGIVGIGTGAFAGWQLNRRLQPHMLNLALNITGLGHDDLFYFHNKVRIDDLGLSFRRTADDLQGPAQLDIACNLR